MIPTILSSVFGGLTILALGAILWGFRLPIQSMERDVSLFVRGFAIIALGYMLRGFYWDVLWQTVRYYDRSFADAWSEITGGTAINIIFYMVVLYGAYLVLLSRAEMVPLEERSAWPWWRAWTHPNGLPILRWPFRW